MVMIPPPDLPLYLYRYRWFGPDSKNLNREIEALTKPYIYCADFNRLNDPMEGYYRPSKMLRSKQTYKQIVRAFRDGKSGVGIASLSDTPHNELMWTHYAGGYSGFCIEFYARRLSNALSNDVLLVRLGYDDQPPRISGKDARDVPAAACKILSQKKYNWAYEREWRLLAPVDLLEGPRRGQLRIGANDVIRRILVGSNMEDQDKGAILHAFRNKQVDIEEMVIDGYDKIWVPIQGPKYERKRKAENKRRARPSR